MRADPNQKTGASSSCIYNVREEASNSQPEHSPTARTYKREKRLAQSKGI
ncbi:hypothetical protein LguiA_029939 [Lonicera macranthoides]